jgi:predicted Zn-dependent protease
MPELLLLTADELQMKNNWLEADRFYRQLLDDRGHINSNVNRAYGQMLLILGLNNEALVYLQRAKRLSPLDAAISFYFTVASIIRKE